MGAETRSAHVFPACCRGFCAGWAGELVTCPVSGFVLARCIGLVRSVSPLALLDFSGIGVLGAHCGDPSAQGANSRVDAGSLMLRAVDAAADDADHELSAAQLSHERSPAVAAACVLDVPPCTDQDRKSTRLN